MITFSRLGRYGQLGNQLFQVAMLLGVAAKRGYEVRIPKKYHGRKKKDLVELKPLHIRAKMLQEHDRRRLKNTYEEQTFAFDPHVFEQPDFTDYRGYFQTSRYFQHAETQVRDEFRFGHELDQFARQYVYQLRNTDLVVAVHVRRGDYLEHADLFHVLTPEYYARAMQHEALGNVAKQFIVFSDDINWCRDNLVGENVAFCRSPSHWHDLAIMTYCDAHIISASSFSWWGAWLCHRRPNVVIAPDPWFPSGRDLDTKDILPAHWRRLPVSAEDAP